MLTVIPRGGVHQGTVHGLAFSPDGKVLASGGMDRTVWFWEVATGRPSGRIRENDREITALAFAPDGSLLAGGTSLGVSLWRVGTSQAGVKPVHGVGQGHSLAFLPGGREMLSLEFSPHLASKGSPLGLGPKVRESAVYLSEHYCPLSGRQTGRWRRE